MAAQLHFVLMPLPCPGHIIPMVDIAKLLASRDNRNIITIITTHLNAARYLTGLDHAINVAKLHFPGTKAGLPEGCESIDLIPSRDLYRNFFEACAMLQQQVENLLEEMKPCRPSCIIADKHLPWMANVSSKFRIPRILFDGSSCLYLLCNYILQQSKVYETASKLEPFVVPGFPHPIQLTRAQLPESFNPATDSDELQDHRQSVREGEKTPHGIMINSFEELEQDFVNEYKRVTGHKVWCIGPVSLSNSQDLDKVQRGNKAAPNPNHYSHNHYMNWLDSQAPGSTIYACLGSLNRILPQQLIEFGMALEASNRPFIWVIRGAYKKEEAEKLLEENGFEERVKGKGILVRGWAPQVLILSHPSIGGFLTHCGWNSTLEGICAGVPMITWPLFAEQFLNEKLVVQILGTGERVGAEVVVHLGKEDEFGVMVKREKIREAIDKVMSEEKQGKERKEKAKKLGEVAKRAVEGGGSSYLNMTLFIEDIKQLVNNNLTEA